MSYESDAIEEYIAGLKDELARLRQESAERLRIMVERGNEIARLREDLRMAETLVKEANEQAEGLGEARDRLREDYKDCQGWYRAAKDEIARLREQGGLLTEQVMHMDNEIIRLLEELDRHHPTIPCTICGE